MKKFGLFFLFSFISSFYVWGQAEQLDSKIPMIRGLKHASFSTMKSPHIKTTFFLELGLGESGIFTSDGLPVGDTTILNLNSELLFVELKGGYQQRVKEWISFFVNIHYAARLGNSIESIYVSGVNTIITVEPGISFRIKHTDKFAISGYVKLTNTESTIIDVKRYVDDLVSGNPYASITKDVPALNGGGGLTLSYSFSPSFGLNTDGQLVYGETLRRGDPELQYYIGGNLVFNFSRLFKLPISIVGGGYANTLTNAFSTQGDLTSTFIASINYTGSDSFILGLEVYRGQTPIEESGRRVQLSGFSILTKFYF